MWKNWFEMFFKNGLVDKNDKTFIVQVIKVFPDGGLPFIKRCFELGMSISCDKMMNPEIFMAQVQKRYNYKEVYTAELSMAQEICKLMEKK